MVTAAVKAGEEEAGEENNLIYEFVCSDYEYNNILFYNDYSSHGQQIVFNGRIESPYGYFYNRVNEDRCICPTGDLYTFTKTKRNTSNLQDYYSGLCNPK